MARLIVNPGTSQLWEVQLKDGINTVGRGAANDVVISEPSISGSHCHVIVSNGSVCLKDLGSTNGTFVNRMPVTEMTLQPGQRIHLGSVELLFEDGSPPNARRVPVAVPIPASPQSNATATNTTAHAMTPPASGRLRIAGLSPEPATATVESEPEVPEVDAAPAFAAEAPSNAPCKYHPRSLARWQCAKCHKTYCDLCVTTRPAAGTQQKFCRSCGGGCAPLQVRIEAPKAKSFFKELPRAVIYPFRGTGVLILIVATILFAALDFMSRGLIGLAMKALALGYLFSYVQNILHSTANDDDQMPELPAMDDLLGGFFRLVGTVLISFGPALVLAYLAIFQQQPMAGIALIPGIIFGCLYFPMAFLAVAMKDNAMAANPLVVVPSILRVPVEYIVTAILLTGLFAFRWAGDALSAVMGQKSLMTTSISEMFLLFGLRALWAFVSVYLLTVTMRILGLLYLTKRHRLGW